MTRGNRRRLKAAFLTATTMGVLAADQALAPAPAFTFQSPSSTATTRPVTPKPTSANDFTQIFQDKNDFTWSGGDQMTSFAAPNGKVYWLAGDTMISNGEDPDGTYPDGTRMIPNRILLQDGSNFTNAMADNGLGIPNPPSHTDFNQERYWPQAMFAANGSLYVLAQRVIKDPSTSLGFELIGSELAKFTTEPKTGKLTFAGMQPTPGTNKRGVPGVDGIQWAGDAIVKGKDTYVYGFTRAKDNPVVLHYSYVARVPTRDVEDPTKWQYYQKSTNKWVADTSELSDDVVNQPDAILASQVSSVRVIKGKVVILHKPWNGMGDKVNAEIGEQPQGPFKEEFLFDSPAGTFEGSNYETYAPMLHPEQKLEGAESGRTLISINWNGKDFVAAERRNADLYKPRFDEVDLGIG